MASTHFPYVEWIQFAKKKLSPPIGWKDFYKKRLVKTFLPFCVWSLIYAIPLMASGDINIGEFLESFVQSNFNGYMWFFIPLFAFYISIPVLSSWLKITTDREFFYYMLVIFILLYIIQPIYRYMDWGFFKYNIIPIGSSLLFYPLLGYAIYRLPIFDLNKKKVYVIGLLAAILHFAILSYSILVLGIKSNRFQNVEEATSALMAVAVFLWFKNHNWEGLIQKLHKLHLNSNTIKSISSCSLGVYLLQALLFLVSKKTGIPFLNPYIGAFLTYVVALPLVMLMKKTPCLRYIVP